MSNNQSRRRNVKNSLSVAAAAAMAICFSSTANAELVDNGHYTTDNTSGLDWLDLTQTRWFNRDYINSQLVPGGRFEGWRYATEDDLERLFTNIGWNGKRQVSPESDGLTNFLAPYVGYKEGARGGYHMKEIVGLMVKNNGEPSMGGLVDWEHPYYIGQDSVCPSYCFFDPLWPGNMWLGSWLVRQTEAPFLTVTPPSGDYLATQSFDIGIIIRDTTPITNVSASIDGYDRSSYFQSCFVEGTFSVIGQTLRCPDVSVDELGGVGEHEIEFTITFSSGKVLSQYATWNVVDSREP